MPEFMDICLQAAHAGGKVLLEWQEKIHPREKAPRDLVTEADLASQEIIQKIVLNAFPDHDFLGEEDVPSDAPDPAISGGEYRWIVDPLDGTLNYVHKLPPFAVSIALERKGEVIAGVIWDPILKECYRAELGKGAFVNDQPLKSSVCQELDQAMVASSFSTNVSRDSEEITRFIDVLLECQSLRRLGSAALNLCYVASGRLDGYWATSVKTWDVAAGFLIVQEAGGVITTLNGRDVDLAAPKFCASANPTLHEKLLQILNGKGTLRETNFDD